jgi:hypothetical protein
MPVEPPAEPMPEWFRWDDANKRWASSDTARATARMRAVLPEFRADGEPLVAAVARLAKVAGLTAVFDPATADAVRGAKPVTVAFRGAPATDVLSAVVDAAAPGNALSWCVDGDTLVIVPREDAGRYAITTRYDLRDWFAGVEAAAGKDGRHAEWTHQTFAAMLTAVLTTNIDRDSWTDRGGKVGRVYEVGGYAFITQTNENQERIRRFLDALRRKEPETVLEWGTPGSNP